MANKIVAVITAKNDADIIESSIRHAAKFVDEVFVLDRDNVDDTARILKSLLDEKLPLRIFETDVDSMIQTAVSENANIILPIHADEFLIAVDGKNSADLRKFLQGLDPEKIFSLPKNRCRFLDSEEDQDLYALSRSVLREFKRESYDIYNRFGSLEKILAENFNSANGSRQNFNLWSIGVVFSRSQSCSKKIPRYAGANRTR